MMRDYAYVEQRASLRIDVLDQKIYGTSELFLSPRIPNLSTIRVHARQMKIQNVFVNGIETSFEHLNFLNDIVQENYRDLNAFDVCYRGAIVASKEGELVIQLPPSLVITLLDTTTTKFSSMEKELSWNIQDFPKSSTEYAILHVKIVYDLIKPKGGIQFMLPSLEESRSPHCFTHAGPVGGLCDGARTWLPCRDTLQDVCPFKMEFIVPKWCTAVSCGALIETFLMDLELPNEQVSPPEKTWKVFRYVVPLSVTAASIGFAVGPFRTYVPTGVPRITHFCLPEMYTKMKTSVEKSVRVLDFFEKWLKIEYPLPSYQQVFIESPREVVQGLSGCALLDQSILYDATVIDYQLTSHLYQVTAFVSSWMHASVVFATTKDAWFRHGLIQHMVNIYVKKEYGEEEYGFRIQGAMDALTTLETLARISKQPSPTLVTPEVEVYSDYSQEAMHFIHVKAPLFFHMIEQKVTSKTLRTVIKQLFSAVYDPTGTVTVPAVVEEIDIENKPEEVNEENVDVNGVPTVDGVPTPVVRTTNEALSALSFLRDLKALAGASGSDLLKTFFFNWAIQGGMPFFKVGFWYNRKQTQAEVVVKQIVPLGGKVYTGPITITVVEDTGTFSHPFPILEAQHKWDIPCHNKVRKKRRRRQGLTDPDDIVSVVGPGMGLNDTPVYWVNVDVKGAWLRHIVMQQPDFNSMEQLLSDEYNSMSRFAAARCLALYPRPQDKVNIMSCRALTECLSGLSTHSKRLRTEAARSLGFWQTLHAPATCANTSLPIWVGMRNLLSIFKNHFYDKKTDMPLPNYFLPSGGNRVEMESSGNEGPITTSTSNIKVIEYAAGEYAIKKGIPRACAFLRSSNGQSPAELETFLLALLQNNDNSKNYVDLHKSQVVEDGYYVGTILLTLSQMMLDRPTKEGDKDTTVQETLRYLQYDTACPGYQSVVSTVCLEVSFNFVAVKDALFFYALLLLNDVLLH